MAKKIKTTGFWITFFIGVTFAYFIWLVWRKLTEWIGDSNWVLVITGAIVLIGIFTGHFSWKKIAQKFG